MLSDAKLLELVFGAAMCYVPDEELDESQLEKLDNIRYQWCKCKLCLGPFKIAGKVIMPKSLGHANRRTLEIGISKPFLKKHIKLPPQIFLIHLISACLHEIIHVVFPELSEDKVLKKTSKWLRRGLGQFLGDLVGTS